MFNLQKGRIYDLWWYSCWLCTTMSTLRDCLRYVISLCDFSISINCDYNNIITVGREQHDTAMSQTHCGLLRLSKIFPSKLTNDVRVHEASLAFRPSHVFQCGVWKIVNAFMVNTYCDVIITYTCNFNSRGAISMGAAGEEMAGTCVTINTIMEWWRNLNHEN